MRVSIVVGAVSLLLLVPAWAGPVFQEVPPGCHTEVVGGRTRLVDSRGFYVGELAAPRPMPGEPRATPQAKAPPLRRTPMDLQEVYGRENRPLQEFDPGAIVDAQSRRRPQSPRSGATYDPTLPGPQPR